MGISLDIIFSVNLMKVALDASHYENGGLRFCHSSQ